MIDLGKRERAWDEFSGESMEWTVSNTFNAAYELGVRDGAASVDRAGVVQMFEAVMGRCLGKVELERLDEYLSQYKGEGK